MIDIDSLTKKYGLLAIAQTHGLPRSRVNEVLTLVGLDAQGRTVHGEPGPGRRHDAEGIDDRPDGAGEMRRLVGLLRDGGDRAPQPGLADLDEPGRLPDCPGSPDQHAETRWPTGTCASPVGLRDRAQVIVFAYENGVVRQGETRS